MVSGEELHLVSSILPRTYSCTPLSATCYLIVKFRPIYLVYIGSRLAVRQQYGKIQGLSVEVTSCWCFLSPPPTTSVLPILGAGSRSVLFSVRILLTTLSSTLSLHCASVVSYRCSENAFYIGVLLSRQGLLSQDLPSATTDTLLLAL